MPRTSLLETETFIFTQSFDNLLGGGLDAGFRCLNGNVGRLFVERLAHYQKRLAMAEKLGLLRLREVFQAIIASKRSHMKHAAIVAAVGSRPRQLG